MYFYLNKKPSRAPKMRKVDKISRNVKVTTIYSRQPSITRSIYKKKRKIKSNLNKPTKTVISSYNFPRTPTKILKMKIISIFRSKV